MAELALEVLLFFFGALGLGAAVGATFAVVAAGGAVATAAALACAGRGKSPPTRACEALSMGEPALASACSVEAACCDVQLAGLSLLSVLTSAAPVRGGELGGLAMLVEADAAWWCSRPSMVELITDAAAVY